MILTEAAMGLGGAVPIAPYRRPGTEDLAEITCQATGKGSAAIMAHHGLITVGETIDLAYFATIAAENTAEILIMARSMGCKALTLDSSEVSALHEMTVKHKPLPA
jgi:ribulose-5-phosphate 4-epimerase/fuculose-1-phosphate aldolase